MPKFTIIQCCCTRLGVVCVKCEHMQIFSFVGVTFEAPWDESKFLEKERLHITSWQTNYSYFCRLGNSPKVQMPFETPPGFIPRKVAVER